ncbi:putative 3-hydroxyisobutyryl-CoA hydrolase [Rosa chinensis]|uniref:3-hydroxyisobutyryl-CoA hydrolase n=1 Tax=Rosa chinensis TaxID=74649 RepID=A0A2P6SHS5_ROSCH|nr:3-hydroxyisobutyryl-CoA hydrolase 1 [Rosa chinensis]PRQ58245.1 putative 3-hydroxyisobutyryl-CoA hydrolase [Rosa chinensis]
MASFSSDYHDNGNPEILVQENNPFIRTLTLHKPQKLNVLSTLMILQLFELFLNYEHDAFVKLVILKSSGKAFSAGGDIANIAHHLYNGNLRHALKLYKTAYTLMYFLAIKTKPQVSFLNGITMGMGAGVSIHGSFRVATEKTVFAMPETAIGSFPDIGSSYYLSRLLGFFGEYLGLTGARLDGPEMLALGLATHFVPSSKLALLEEALARKLDSSSTNTSSADDCAIISAILDEYSEQPAPKMKSAYHYMDVIDKCFSQSTVEEILSSLEKELATIINITDHHEWLLSAIQSLRQASPTSLKIALRSIRGGRRLQGVGECIVREYRIIYHVLCGEISNDFMEGCRAILLDKDKNPKWKPSRLELVTDQMVGHYFSRLHDDEELKLPQRSKLSATAISKL